MLFWYLRHSSPFASPPQAEAFSLFPRVPSRARTGVIASRAASRFYRPGSLLPPPRSTMATQDTRRLRHARRTCRTSASVEEKEWEKGWKNRNLSETPAQLFQVANAAFLSFRFTETFFHLKFAKKLFIEQSKLTTIQIEIDTKDNCTLGSSGQRPV